MACRSASRELEAAPSNHKCVRALVRMSILELVGLDNEGLSQSKST